MRADADAPRRGRVSFARLLLRLAAAASIAGSAGAQRAGAPPVEIQLPSGGVSLAAADGGTEAPRVAIGAVLSSAETRELVRSGFPAQLRFRLELWRGGGWFYDLEGAVTWDVVVAYDPRAQIYRVRRRVGTQLTDVGSFATLTSAQEAIARPFPVALLPTRRGRQYYYNLVLDVETLSVSDLDQLERWLRGELRPAVRGENNPASALGNGMRTLVTRVLGGERRHYEARSVRFRA